MEKRSDYERKSERVKVSDEEVKKEVKSSSPKTVRLVLLKQLNLKYKGPITGNTYTFSGAGAEADVDEKDAEIMLAKRGGLCCQGSGVGTPQPYFAKV